MISHDHKFPSECFSITAVSKYVTTWTVFFFKLTLTLSSSFLFKLVIPLKSELAVEMQEKGRVRFWLQAEKMSANGKVDYVFNDNLLSQGEVSEQKGNENNKTTKGMNP